MPKPLYLTPSDINLFLDLGRTYFTNIPANIALNGEPQNMSEQQFRAMCMMKAALAVFVKRGIVDAEVDVGMDHSIDQLVEE